MLSINRLFDWMDGSLFFKGFTAFFVFLKRIALGSFIARFFVGDYKPGENVTGGVRGGLFVRAADWILNKLPKPLVAPDTDGESEGLLVRSLSGSFIINQVLTSLGVPLPAGGKYPLLTAFKWILFAAPVLGITLVILAAPILPTMMLAGLLVPVFILTFFSRSFEVSRLTVFLMLFIAVNIVAGVLSLAPASSMQIAVLVSVFMAVVIIIPACCKTGEGVDVLFLAFLAGAGLTGIVGLYQVVGRYVTGGAWLDHDTFVDIELRVSSTLGNPNVYGAYLLLAIPLAAAAIVYFKNIFLKLLSAGLTGLLLFNLLMTYSRGCYLGLALAVGIFVLIMEKRFVVMFIPALLALPFVLPASIINRFLSIIDFANMDTSTIFRISIWQGSVRILQDFWMIGLGQGAEAFNRVFPFYALAASVAEHAHNTFLQMAIELGLLGLLVFIGFLACFFRTMANFLRRTTEFRHRVVAAAMIAAVIGFLLQGIFDHVFYNFRVLLTFYIFVGFGMAFVKAYGSVGAAPLLK